MDAATADIREYEEKLREAASLGDENCVRELVKAGVDVNSQNRMNGWTPLHWAAKRGHSGIVNFLLDHGARSILKNFKDETPLNIATDPQVRNLLGGELNGEVPQRDEMPIVPNYLANPTFPYLSQTPEKPVNLSVGSSDTRDASPTPPPARTENNSYLNTEEDELVLKVRVANVAEKDYIEVELDKKNLTYDNLIETMCKELEINRKFVWKIRKLPDTILRKDKDVKRLIDFQELEIVLTSRATSESSRNYNGPSVSPKHIDVVY